jgi:hypothetical protein
VIRKATLADRQEIIDILSEAFEDDPVMGWISNHPGYPRFSFEAVFDALAPSDEYFVDAHGLGATLWLKPGETMK